MSLIIPPAPAQSIDALRGVVPSILDGPLLAKIAPRLAAALTNPSVVRSLSPALSYRVYTLGLSDLASAAGDGFRAATLSAWRHTLAFNGEVVTADVSVDPGGHRFASLGVDPSSRGMQTAIDALAKDPDVANASYEVSLLQVPALGVRALWLRDPSRRDDDILVPVAPVRSDLVAGRSYKLAEFTNALNDAAAKILADDDPRKGSA
jgi:hypothetical protein